MNSNEQIICPACGCKASVSTNIVITPTGRMQAAYRRCKNCKSYFNPVCYNISKEVLHTQLSTAWGNKKTGTDLEYSKSLMYESILSLLCRYYPPPATLLDVGCSFGGFLSRARRSGYLVAGIDIVPEAVEYVRSLDIKAHVSNEINGDPFYNEGELDVISMLDSNYYFPNQKDEFLSAKHKLRHGGLLVMRVADKSWIFGIGLKVARIFPSLGKKILHRAINDHRFSMPVKSLLGLLESLDFKILYASPYGAQHSDKSSIGVKVSFVIGYIIWKTFGAFLAPGCVILAKKE